MDFGSWQIPHYQIPYSRFPLNWRAVSLANGSPVFPFLGCAMADVDITLDNGALLDQIHDRATCIEEDLASDSDRFADIIRHAINIQLLASELQTRPSFISIQNETERGS